MPLTGSSATLKTALRAALLAADCGVGDNAALTRMCDAIATTVLDHIVSNAVVNSLGLIAPPGTAGGPVTGATTLS
jgi:hypothetical protein